MSQDVECLGVDRVTSRMERVAEIMGGDGATAFRVVKTEHRLKQIYIAWVGLSRMKLMDDVLLCRFFNCWSTIWWRLWSLKTRICVTALSYQRKHTSLGGINERENKGKWEESRNGKEVNRAWNKLLEFSLTVRNTIWSRLTTSRQSFMGACYYTVEASPTGRNHKSHFSVALPHVFFKSDLWTF